MGQLISAEQIPFVCRQVLMRLVVIFDIVAFLPASASRKYIYSKDPHVTSM